MTLALALLTPLSLRDPLFPTFVQALASASLPIDDLEGGARIYATTADSAAVAFGGLEGKGADQLLRSIVVPTNARGSGYGRQIVDALAREARVSGAERLWLLTTTADGFFATLGWSVVNRTSAPEVIRESRQFSGLCPSSAVLMCRHLA